MSAEAALAARSAFKAYGTLWSGRRGVIWASLPTWTLKTRPSASNRFVGRGTLSPSTTWNSPFSTWTTACVSIHITVANLLASDQMRKTIDVGPLTGLPVASVNLPW